jgi:hypothetical protein
MSKGIGPTQRAILAELEHAGRPCSAVELAATMTGTPDPSPAAIVSVRRAINALAGRRLLECGDLRSNLYHGQRIGLYAWLPGQSLPDTHSPVEHTGDAAAVVRLLIDAWHKANELDRDVAASGLGAPPSLEAVPYRWITWKGRRMLQGEERARRMALLRTLRAMESAGEVAIHIFLESGRFAWIVPANSCTVTHKCNSATDNPAQVFRVDVEGVNHE